MAEAPKTKARWQRIMFNPLWREISTDPLWSKHWRSFNILYISFLLLLAGASIMAFHSEELWLLTFPTVAIAAGFWGVKVLARRYENILNLLAENRSLESSQSLPPPPTALLGAYKVTIAIVILALLATSFFGIAISAEKNRQRALAEHQTR